MENNAAAWITLAMFALNILMFLLTFGSRWWADRRLMRRKHIEAALEQQIMNHEVDIDSIDPDELMPIYVRLRENLMLDKGQQDYLMHLLLDSGTCVAYLRRLRSYSYVRRCQAAAGLKYLESRDVQEALLEALRIERNSAVIIQLAHALALQKVTKAIAPTVAAIRRVEPWVAKRLMAILYTYQEDFKRYAVRRLTNRRSYMQRLLCGFALEYPAEEFRTYLVSIALGEHKVARNTALAALLKHFPEELRQRAFLESTHRRTLAHVVQALALTNDKDRLQQILPYGRYRILHDIIVVTLSTMSAREPAMLNDIRDRFRTCTQKQNRELLAKVLENRIEYFLNRLTGPEHDDIVTLLFELIKAHHTSAMLFFLNRTKDKAIELQLVKVLRQAAVRNQLLRAEMRHYLDMRLQKELKLTMPGKSTETPKPHSEPPKRFQLAIILIAVLVFFPVVILASEFTSLASLTWAEIGRLYIVRFNYLLVFYSVTVNLIYLAVLAVSVHGGRIQARMWNLKDDRFLFTKGLLPSISIIAPAYNEMANIIESTNSLLNQRYPDFELIVVNDGSKDETLNTLITYYNLEKRDMLVRKRLPTRALRGIYTNKNIPNLIVVDKMNGGKADSLNMGLNVASKEYFCGIDADSLLEGDALLRAVAVMIDSPHESVAAGGNICPVNGCTVERGYLDNITLPKNFIARLQSLEYMRAFMAGRVGWAHMNLLLIISGAFGIFNRERTIRTGGYLTKSGRYRKDTVGEDMELVVRISRYMREMKLPYSVDYAFNANCWTEVPETWKVLHRQRDRWHRGLVDILLFHRKLIANPRYGRLGMAAMLYYFLFEMIGPFIEAQGLLMVIISALVGLLNVPTALLLFNATILMGVFVSLSAVFVADMDRHVYGRRDVLRLLWMAVLENFGPRQAISFWRVSGFFSSMKKSKGWGAQVRKGFTPGAAPVTPTQQKKTT